MGVSYTDIMQDCEDLVRFIHTAIYGDRPLEYQGKTIDIQRSWERLTMKEAFSLYAQVNFDELIMRLNAYD